jgi:quercetin dioxygenase-like cupin family protein
MKKRQVFYIVIIFSVLYCTGVVAQDASTFPKGEKAPNVHHTGDVWLYHVSDADKTFHYGLTQAVFAKGAKLDWHKHPAGQQLIITEGIGFYQERGKQVQTVQKGDVVKCEPDVEHWHAATPTTGVTYLAITGNEPTEWLEPVKEEEFNNIELTVSNTKNVEKEIMDLSKKKWDWMADKNVNQLDDLFHEQSVFVHMGGSWGKEQELSVIESGGIWYKKADVKEVSLNVMGNTAILLNNITLLAVVGGNEVTNPFEVTEVYVKEDGNWKLSALSFTKLLGGDSGK